MNETWLEVTTQIKYQELFIILLTYTKSRQKVEDEWAEEIYEWFSDAWWLTNDGSLVSCPVRVLYVFPIVKNILTWSLHECCWWSNDALHNSFLFAFLPKFFSVELTHHVSDSFSRLFCREWNVVLKIGFTPCFQFHWFTFFSFSNFPQGTFFYPSFLPLPVWYFENNAVFCLSSFMFWMWWLGKSVEWPFSILYFMLY